MQSLFNVGNVRRWVKGPYWWEGTREGRRHRKSRAVRTVRRRGTVAAQQVIG